MTAEDIFRRYAEPLTIPIAGDLEAALLSVAEVLPLELSLLDKKVREVSQYSSLYQSWPQIGASELEQILNSPTSSVYLIGLISFHRSGYIRELAVSRLAENTSGASLSFLLLRLNDWVSPVYQAASTAVQARITPQYVDALVRNISLIFSLSNQTRQRHEALLSAITTLLKRPECDAALQRGLAAKEKEDRRLCFRLLREANDARLPDSLPRMLADADPVIRQAAARCTRTALSESALRAVLPLMKQDASFSVRREVLYIYLERLPGLASLQLREALLDTQATLRGIARYYLQQTNDFDVPAFYRQTLATSKLSPSTLRAAVYGLGETGAPVDVSLILPYLSHPLARVRRAAVKAVSRLDGDNQINLLLAALTDVRPSVVHEAREALQPRLHLLEEDILWGIFRSETPFHIRQDVLRLFRALPKWDAISFLVMAAVDEDPQIQEQAAKHLQDWSANFNHSFTRPNAMQLTRLEKALQLNPNVFLEHLVSGLRKRGITRDTSGAKQEP